MGGGPGWGRKVKMGGVAQVVREVKMGDGPSWGGR